MKKEKDDRPKIEISRFTEKARQYIAFAQCGKCQRQMNVEKDKMEDWFEVHVLNKKGTDFVNEVVFCKSCMPLVIECWTEGK